MPIARSRSSGSFSPCRRTCHPGCSGSTRGGRRSTATRASASLLRWTVPRRSEFRHQLRDDLSPRDLVRRDECNGGRRAPPAPCSLPHASLQHGCHVEAAADLGEVSRLSLHYAWTLLDGPLRRHRLHEKGQRFLEAGRADRAAFVMAQTHDDELMRRDDQGRLASCAVHEVRVLRNRQSRLPIDPEKTAVDGAPICLPGRRERAHEFDVSVGQDPFTVPDTILKVEVAETRPVARRGKVVPLPEKVPEWIGLDHHGPDPDPIEERALWEGQVILAPPLDR